MSGPALCIKNALVQKTLWFNKGLGLTKAFGQNIFFFSLMHSLCTEATNSACFAPSLPYHESWKGTVQVRRTSHPGLPRTCTRGGWGYRCQRSEETLVHDTPSALLGVWCFSTQGRVIPVSQVTGKAVKGGGMCQFAESWG